jgi:hypothetical protein
VEGSVYGELGSVVTRPLSAVDYLNLIVIPENFPLNTAVIGSQQLPEVAEAVATAHGLSTGSVDAARTRIAFNNGVQDVEAHIYAWINYTVITSGTTLWSPVPSPSAVYLVYATPERFDEEAPFLNSLALSSILNPEWEQLVVLVEELRRSGSRRTQELMNA